MVIEEKLSIGLVSVRIVTMEEPAGLVQDLRSRNYGVTCVDAEGGTGPVKMVFSILRRQDLPSVISMIHQYHPGAFYTIEETKSASEGIFPDSPRPFPAALHRTFWFLRKGK